MNPELKILTSWWYPTTPAGQSVLEALKVENGLQYLDGRTLTGVLRSHRSGRHPAPDLVVSLLRAELKRRNRPYMELQT